MKNICSYIVLLLVVLLNNSNAQRISTGFNFSTTVFHKTTLPDYYIFPEHSYFIYYTINDKSYLPEHNQALNGISLGLNLNVDYKRFMLISEFNLGYTSIKLPVLYPTQLGADLDEQWSSFHFTKLSFNIPVLLSYKLSRKANGLFLVGGIQYSFLSWTEDNSFGDLDISSGISLFLSDTEMYGVLYNEFNYASVILGAGYKRKNNSYSIRYSQRFGGNLSEYPLARYFQLDLNYSKTLNFQRLKKGYHLYLD